MGFAFKWMAFKIMLILGPNNISVLVVVSAHSSPSLELPAAGCDAMRGARNQEPRIAADTSVKSEVPMIPRPVHCPRVGRSQFDGPLTSSIVQFRGWDSSEKEIIHLKRRHFGIH